MALLNAEQFLAKRELPFEDVDCPELGGAVRIRALTEGEKIRWSRIEKIRQEPLPDITKLDGFRASIIVATAINEDGSKMFPLPDEKPEVELARLIELIDGNLASAVERLSDAAVRIAGMGGELEKN